MAFDPYREDYQRLVLRYASSLDQTNALKAARAFASFGRRFSETRDSLPQSDSDRAFNLVAQATNLIDYTLPFAPEEKLEDIAGEAARLLNEALELDPDCYDARRMLTIGAHASFDECYHALLQDLEEVRRGCEDRRDAAAETPLDLATQTPAATSIPADDMHGSTDLAASMELWPLERWLATLASKALICGRYRACVAHSLQLLDLDPEDLPDVRLTCALAYAKLEDDRGLEALARRCSDLSDGETEDAWLALSRMAIAFKRGDLDGARTHVRGLIKAYPFAGMTLSRQDELPDGVFSRLDVDPFSEDELILAVSEATVVLQEGRDPSERGTLGSWMAELPEVVDAARRDEQSDRESGPRPSGDTSPTGSAMGGGERE
jgi:tetratricopeptide (TPR) repeat protein